MPITGIKSAEGIESQNQMQSLTADEQKQLAIALEQMKAQWHENAHQRSDCQTLWSLVDGS